MHVVKHINKWISFNSYMFRPKVEHHHTRYATIKHNNAFVLLNPARFTIILQ